MVSITHKYFSELARNSDLIFATYPGMNSKSNYSPSSCYGFFFNILVALCTVGFMCYFIHRFDSRLLLMERRLSLLGKPEGYLVTSSSPGYVGRPNFNKDVLSQRKMKKNRKFDSEIQARPSKKSDKKSTKRDRKRRVFG